jgi:hypothetical protein
MYVTYACSWHVRRFTLPRILISLLNVCFSHTQTELFYHFFNKLLASRPMSPSIRTMLRNYSQELSKVSSFGCVYATIHRISFWILSRNFNHSDTAHHAIVESTKHSSSWQLQAVPRIHWGVNLPNYIVFEKRQIWFLAPWFMQQDVAVTKAIR